MEAEAGDEAEALASQLAAGPTKAYAATKAAILAAKSATDFQTYLKEEARLQGKLAATADYKEGVMAFLEKRPAKFNGL
ncbi:MAG: enoyl-CoA hydratase-related protein [Rhodomicrobium sp.]